MKRILFLTATLSSGGAERQMTTIARLLKDKGYVVEFLCFAKSEDFYSNYLEENGIAITKVYCKSTIHTALMVRHLIRNGMYDVVISFIETPNLLNNISAIGGKRWKVITGERSSKMRTFTSLKGKFRAWFRRFSDVVVCNSYHAQDLWNKYYPVFSDKLTVIYNTVILGKIDSEYVPFRNGKLNILIAASYQKIKNPYNFVDAIHLLGEEQLAKIHIDWYGRKEFTTGDAHVYYEIERKIKDYHLEGIVSLHDATKNIANKMNEADIVALFSVAEGLPNSICEALSIGKPILMTKVSDYNELVTPYNGILCESFDPESLAESFVKALQLSKFDLIRMGNNSRCIASALFSQKAVCDAWINIIEK